MRNGLSLYQVDESLIRDIAPDLILTQDLCQVCAPSGNEVATVVERASSKPQILWLREILERYSILARIGRGNGHVLQRPKT